MEIKGPSSNLKTMLAVIAGVAIMAYGGYGLMEQNSAVRNAEAINATITSTGVVEESARRGVEYRPTAEYTYSFQGEEYTSEKVYPGPLTSKFNSEERARKEVNYSEGETVQAFVNPETPGEAFLKKEKSGSPFFLIALGALMTAISSYSIIKP